jgi:hypothetical protein
VLPTCPLPNISTTQLPTICWNFLHQNWVLVSNSQLTSAVQDVVFFSPPHIFWFWMFGNFSKFTLLKIQKTPNTFVIKLPISAPKKVGAEVSLCNIMVFHFNFVIPKFWWMFPNFLENIVKFILEKWNFSKTFCLCF